MAVSGPFIGSQGSATAVASVATIAGLAFNAEASDRLIAAAITMEVTATITGVTIGGVTAAEWRQARDTAPTPDITAAIFVAAVPTGTTGDVVVTVSGNNPHVAVTTFSVTGADGSGPSDSDAATGSAADISIASLTIPTDGAGLCCFANMTNTTAVTWTNASEENDVNITTSATHRHSTATVSAVGTNTITADGATAGQALVGVAWGPAAGGSPTSLVIPPTPLPPAMFAAQQWHPEAMRIYPFSNTPAPPPAASLIYRPTFFDHMIIR